MRAILLLLPLSAIAAPLAVTLHSGAGTGMAQRCFGSQSGSPACQYATLDACAIDAAKYKFKTFVCKAAGPWGADQVRVESIDGTSIPGAADIVDRSLAVWTLRDGVVYRNGVAAGFTSGVTRLSYKSGEVVQTNAANRSWAWRDAWVEITAPTSRVEPGYWKDGVYFSPASMAFNDVNTGLAGFRPCVAEGQICIGVGDVVYGSTPGTWSMLRSQGSLACSAEMFGREAGLTCFLR